MNTFIYRPVLTVIDVLDAGACLQGTIEYIKENDGQIFRDTKELLRFGDPSHYIKCASKKDGYGNGTCYGMAVGVDGGSDGGGDGYVYGKIDGFGYGSIYGDGYSDGSGYGDGDGAGYGNRSYYGDGNGSGVGGNECDISGYCCEHA